MKNVLRVVVPVGVIIIGLFILFGVGGGVTVDGSWREFVGASLIAVGILSEVAVWAMMRKEDTSRS